SRTTPAVPGGLRQPRANAGPGEPARRAACRETCAAGRQDRPGRLSGADQDGRFRRTTLLEQLAGSLMTVFSPEGKRGDVGWVAAKFELRIAVDQKRPNSCCPIAARGL